MLIIVVGTLKQSWKKFPPAKQSLLSWYEEAETAIWDNPNDIKDQCRNASILTGKRVVFNIDGNKFRLIAGIEYRLKIAFVVWFGTHAEYDKLNAKINYVKKH
ncbi:MAG: type II toxin-antitoxin system HigB family toxin [Chitinophagaceae bacterium]|nr:type II toxin-antitoxin system HigB family toxin [Chitinophagaceae bacterium]